MGTYPIMNSATTFDESGFKWYCLEAVDGWFFRDGKPFNRGEDQGDMRSLFPPAASTTVGTMRYALAIENGWSGRGSWCDSRQTAGNDLQTVLGDGPEKTGQLQFTGPFVSYDAQPLYAMPRHLLGFQHPVREEGARFRSTCTIVDSLQPGQPTVSDLGDVALPVAKGTHSVPPGDAFPAELDDFFLTHEGMQRVVDGQLPHPNQCVHRSGLYELESRVGIQRDAAARTVIEGQLYNPHFIRLRRDVGLVMGVRGVPEDWQVPSLIAFGGEARMSGLRETTSPGFTSSGSAVRQAALVLLTPAMFSGSWWGAGPGDAASQLSETLTGTVRTVATDRPQRIGGWSSVANNQSSSSGTPIAKQALAPAGTVWWLQSETTDLLPGSIVKVGLRNHLGLGIAVIVS